MKSKLSADEVEAIRQDRRTQRRIAAAYGISQQQVSRLKLGQRRAVEGKTGGCPRVRYCRFSCGHRQLVEEFYAAAEAHGLERELVTHGYSTEGAEYDSEVQPLTFRRWLEGR
jgi:hypothetical protein